VNIHRLFVCLFSAAVLVTNAVPASAQVSGHLTLANCGSEGATVSSTVIDWLPAAGGTGCIATGGGTSVTYAGGTLGPATAGLITDLSPSTPSPVNQFMTFSGTPLNFVLLALGPGPARTACSATLDPNQPVCAAFPGSPFILQPTATGTSVILAASGTVSDGTATSTWSGAFTTQISGQTPAQIQAAINAGQSITSTYSGDFLITAPGQPSRACTLTQGGYKNNFNNLVLNFPGLPPGSNGMTLGNNFYTDAQLNAILQNNAIRGNGLLSLAHQLITAKLNVAYGGLPSSPAQIQTIQTAIADADKLIGNLLIPPIGSGSLSPSVTSGVESILDSYNNGNLGAPHCR